MQPYIKISIAVLFIILLVISWQFVLLITLLCIIVEIAEFLFRLGSSKDKK
jgi:hypothetical protein